MRVLRLYGNEITRSAGVNLALALSSKENLKEVNLNANEFGPSGIDMVISTLDSVGLLHTIENTEEGNDTENDDDDDQEDLDIHHQAFNEDQGSDNEDEEEEGEGGEDEEDTEDYEEDEESELYNSECSQENQSLNSSFNTVKERPVRPDLDLNEGTFLVLICSYRCRSYLSKHLTFVRQRSSFYSFKCVLNMIKFASMFAKPVNFNQ